LPIILRAVARQAKHAFKPDEIMYAGTRALLNAGFDSVDYLEMRDGATLEPLAKAKEGARVFVAARIGGTRLIDNVPV
jgi:pantoate--beta-alanine ligase